MEPMTLGSPSGSPATNPSPYLPAFLMGESQVPTTPRNTLSPNKGSRNISFATSPIQNTPSGPLRDHNRFSVGQKQLFNSSVSANYSGTQGPPTQGLFDSLRNERNLAETPTRGIESQSPLGFGTPIAAQHNLSAFGGNTSFQQHHLQQKQFTPQSTAPYNDSSYLANTSYNTSRCITSPIGPLGTPNANGAINNASYMLQCPPTPRYTEFWVTVFGFPPSAISTILQHFAQCGTIVDKVFPPQNGNWVHLKYASRLECDKALNYNEKILGNNIMIGVTQCKDKNIIDKENVCDNNTQPSNIRPLAQTAYKIAQNDSAVVNNANLPQKSSGLMNKAMDLFFGW
ncbi:nucleoporin Nup35 [Rhagoletis pomonella]|uniref:nucleoporin Nup35 n=1 Tax=Rhagoletis pomonella TaxID=28610 RepID=UPI00178698AE|nr:nucleoporin Nup35 [Rhagoletis pomonella]